MKRPRYDYHGFSLRKLKDPRFSHVLLLSGWIFYFVMYLITENLISPERCHVVHCALDDMIPFCAPFVIFYTGWYVLVVASLAYTLFFNVPAFRKLQTYIFITQVIAMAWYVIYPSIQLMRPETFPVDNVFTKVLGLIYLIDTPTGVCPSLHVAYSLGILSVSLKDKELNRGLKGFLIFLVVMICVSVCFVKQHSAVDVFCAIPVGIAAEILVYGKDYWKPRFQKNKK